MEESGDIELSRLLTTCAVTPTPPVPPGTLLKFLNQLRIHEKRPLLEAIPYQLAALTPAQQSQLLARIKKELKFLRSLPDEPTPLIVLNKTEIILIELNRCVSSELDKIPINHLQYNCVDPDDLPLYYPGQSDKQVQAFITDSDTRLIGTPAIYTDGTFVAPHQLHVSYSQLGAPLPFVSPIVVRTSTPEVKPDTPSESSQSSNASLTDTIEREQREQVRQRQIQFDLTNQYHNKPIPSKPDKMATLTPEELLLRAEGREAMARAKLLEVEEEMAELHKKLAQMSIKDNKEKPKARSEREEIADIKRYINMLTKKVENNLGCELNATVEEQELFLQLHDPAEEDSPKLTHKLTMPTNILEKDTKRPDLAALKPSVISNTIGQFDPDTTPDADFRDVWDNILDHTGNYSIYEHEYIAILRMVMKGSASKALAKISKESANSLALILEALQDLYVPQLTYYDEFDELSRFKRKKGEHIRTTVRRASLAVFPLKNTVSQNAWADRRYNLIKQIVNQVIDPKTARHLRMKDTECLHSGTQLSIESMIQIVSLYEDSHDLLPATDVPLKYNVNTMQMIPGADSAESDLSTIKGQMEALTHEIKTLKALTTKRPRPDDHPSNPSAERANAEFLKSQRARRLKEYPNLQQENMDDTPITPAPGLRRPQTSQDLNRYQPQINNAPQRAQYQQQTQFPQSQPTYAAQINRPLTNRPIAHTGPQYQRSSYPHQSQQPIFGSRQNQPIYYQNYPERNPNYYQSNFLRNPHFQHPTYNRGNTYRGSRNAYRGRDYYVSDSNPQRNALYRQNDRQQNPVVAQRPGTYAFRHDGQSNILLKFYQCTICPDIHQEGTSCPKRDQRPSLNE